MEEAPRIDVEELKRGIDAGEHVAILDVRRGSWERSDVKIRGAVRLELRHALVSDLPFPPGTSVVTYCT